MGVHARAGPVSVRVYCRLCLHVAVSVSLLYITTSLSVCIVTVLVTNHVFDCHCVLNIYQRSRIV